MREGNLVGLAINYRRHPRALSSDSVCGDNHMEDIRPRLSVELSSTFFLFPPARKLPLSSLSRSVTQSREVRNLAQYFGYNFRYCRGLYPETHRVASQIHSGDVPVSDAPDLKPWSIGTSTAFLAFNGETRLPARSEGTPKGRTWLCSLRFRGGGPTVSFACRGPGCIGFGTGAAGGTRSGGKSSRGRSSAQT
jgi:hypothetical protein